MRISISIKLALAILVLMVALTVALAWRLEAEARRQAIGQIRLRGEGVARMLAVNSADELGRLDDLRLAQFVVDASTLPDVLYAAVVDSDGVVFAHSEFEEGASASLSCRPGRATRRWKWGWRTTPPSTMASRRATSPPPSLSAT